jgi:hypothetical protein
MHISDIRANVRRGSARVIEPVVFVLAGRILMGEFLIGVGRASVITSSVVA